MTGKDIIRTLELIEHPEGGFYKRTYESNQSIEIEPGKTRHICTSIYYLLENENKSLFHRIQSDELWFFHQGECLEILCIENNRINTIHLGNDIENGEVPQTKIPANTWFAARLKNSVGYSLVSCTVSPGFDFLDFELADRKKLNLEFPNLKEIVDFFTKK